MTKKGFKHSEETKRKIGLTSLGRMVGYKHSEETLQKMRGRVVSKETRDKLRLANLGRKLGPPSQEIRDKISKGNKGKKLSEETKMKMRLSNLGKNLGNVCSEETRQKLRISSSGRVHSEETLQKMRGRVVSKETRLKIGLANSGKIRSEEMKQNLRDRTVSEETRAKLRETRKHQILPTKDTSIEVKVQNFLTHLKIEYFTHKYMNIAHGYQCDIFIPSKNLVIECDGDYWHHYPTGNDIDHVRTKELIEKGFKVLRLWEFEINKMNAQEFWRRLENEQ